MRYRKGYKFDELGMKIEMTEFVKGFGGYEEGDCVALLCELVGEFEIWSDMPHSKPGEHCYMKSGLHHGWLGLKLGRLQVIFIEGKGNS